jgi:isopentenyl-diphosphate Delta-isomerase
MAKENAKQMVLLVDEHDNEIGLDEKMHAHQNGGTLHRAISVFVFNKDGQTMLQQRADTKYHSQGLWTNTCCSHPFKGESTIDAAHRRLEQEMGFDCEMEEAFSFIYKTEVGNDLIEWEFDHVLFGVYEGEPAPNPEEAKDWKWATMEFLKDDVSRNPDAYTGWSKILMTDRTSSGKLMHSVKKFLLKNGISTSP